jgi:hypothetical protein
MAKSKFFRVAVEGATTDGRKIERSWIADMAETYSPATYGARVNLEHFRGILPDGPFRAYGDVVALKADEIAEGDLKGKLALYAQVEPTPDLIELVKKKQKVFTSIEVNPKFADSGRAYLVGLAVTDSPASLGTEMLTFAAAHPEANPLSGRKQGKDNLFTAASEAVAIEWEDEPSTTSVGELFKQVRERISKLTGKSRTHDSQFAEVAESLQSMADFLEKAEAAQKAATKTFSDTVSSLLSRLDTVDTATKKTADDLKALVEQLSSVPGFTQRPVSTGSGDQALTNC